jgi:hypothetical protein
MHNNIYESNKTKAAYNLERREYCKNNDERYIKLVLFHSNNKVTCIQHSYTAYHCSSLHVPHFGLYLLQNYSNCSLLQPYVVTYHGIQ